MTAVVALAVLAYAALTVRRTSTSTLGERILRLAVFALIIGAAVATAVDLPGTRGVAAAVVLAGAPAGGRRKVKALRDLADPALMSDDALDAEMRQLMADMDRSAKRWSCDRPGCNGRPHKGWVHNHARASQRKPTGAWTTWLMLTGRGWGKTRTAAEAVREWVNESDKPLNIAVIGKKETLVREVCFQHRRSGLLAVFPEDEIERYEKTTGSVTLYLKNGSTIRGFGANEPDNFRGYEFDKIWGDEFAAWNRHVAQEAIDVIWYCLRESASPQVILSTTPKPLPHVKKLIADHDDQVAEIAASDNPDREPAIRITRGKMTDNRENLSDIAISVLARSYGGTRMGKQEQDGILLEDVEGALWQQWMLDWDGFRRSKDRLPDMDQIVVAVDPSVTSGETSDENGIAVVGRSFPFGTEEDDPRPRGYVFHSEAQRSTPHQTLRRVAQLYHQHRADAVVFEVNNGGDYLPALMWEVDPTVICRVVHATRDKRARAAPVAQMYEQQRVHHVGHAVDFDKLETAMTTYVGDAESREKSPDILDALVWALTDLFLTPPRRAQRVNTRDNRLKGRR